jgi:hypothetical protein
MQHVLKGSPPWMRGGSGGDSWNCFILYFDPWHYLLWRSHASHVQFHGVLRAYIWTQPFCQRGPESGHKTRPFSVLSTPREKAIFKCELFKRTVSWEWNSEMLDNRTYFFTLLLITRFVLYCKIMCYRKNTIMLKKMAWLKWDKYQIKFLFILIGQDNQV